MPGLRRRSLLQGLGIGLVAAPFINLLSAPRTRAAGPAGRRLIVFFSPNGTIPQHWNPEGSETDFSFPAGSILEPLTEIQDKLIVVEGLDFFGADNHEGGMRAMLTASGGAGDESGGMSIDQFVASKIGADSRFASLEFGVQTSAWGAGIQTRMSYSAPDVMVSPDDDPAHVYSRLFGDFMGGDEAATKLRTRRQRVVDLLVDEASALRTRLGAEERPKLDAHLEALAKVEKGLAGGAGCAPPVAPDALATGDNANFPAITTSQIDMMVTALACDMTRVASLQCSHTVSPTVPTWLDIADGHHSLSHIDDSNVAGVQQFVQAERWFAEQFKYLVQKLADTDEADGTGKMLDNSVVVWAKEMGDSRVAQLRRPQHHQHPPIDIPRDHLAIRRPRPRHDRPQQQLPHRRRKLHRRHRSHHLRHHRPAPPRRPLLPRRRLLLRLRHHRRLRQRQLRISPDRPLQPRMNARHPPRRIHSQPHIQLILPAHPAPLHRIDVPRIRDQHSFHHRRHILAPPPPLDQRHLDPLQKRLRPRQHHRPPVLHLPRPVHEPHRAPPGRALRSKGPRKPGQLGPFIVHDEAQLRTPPPPGPPRKATAPRPHRSPAPPLPIPRHQAPAKHLRGISPTECRASCGRSCGDQALTARDRSAATTTTSAPDRPPNTRRAPPTPSRYAPSPDHSSPSHKPRS